MKRHILVVYAVLAVMLSLVLFTALWHGSQVAAHPPQARDVGSEECLECHSRQGRRAAVSGHASTWYGNLAQTEAGSANWSEDLETLCDACHVTALMQENLAIGFTCETCHGPGSDHIRNVGGVAIYTPDRQVCADCHYAASHDWAVPHASDPAVMGDYVASLHVPLFQAETDDELASCTDACHRADSRWESRVSVALADDEAAFLDELRAVEALACTRCHDAHHTQINDPF